MAVWLLSWGFALGSTWAFNGARAAWPGTPRVLRAYAVATAAAAVWLTLHLARYGLIGLRTWRW